MSNLPLSSRLSQTRSFRFRAGHERKALLAALFVCGLAGGCTPQDSADINVLSGDAPFVAIARTTDLKTQALRAQSLRTAGSPDQAGVGDDFYLAINKSVMAQRWFLSAYIKQYFPGAVQYGAARSVGTRVVSFKMQNGKMYVFDADDRKQTSDTFNPQVIIDAYPVVTSYTPFERLPGSSNYILFDPAAGQNRYSIFSDDFATGSQPDRFNIELSFLQRFRKVADGVTFEQVFTGYGTIPDPNSGSLGEPNQFRSSGTLGIALRNYTETAGYTPTPCSDADLANYGLCLQKNGYEMYFLGDPAIVPNTGVMAQNPIKWAVSPQRPIQWVISPDIDKYQADPRFKDVDIYGALAKGVTGWNSVFGYEALKIRKATADESFADDTVNYILFDLDTSFGAAFANWRNNPNTAEIRGASVYFSALWLEIAQRNFGVDPMMVAPLAPRQRPKVPWLSWDAMPKQDSCIMWAPIYTDTGRDPIDERLPDPVPDANLTHKDYVEQYITHVLLHEIGHTLGLRHNFKGSLKGDPMNVMNHVFSSSVMEYIDDYEAVYHSTPGTYDIDAIKFLYGIGMSPGKPADIHCADEGTRKDPYCNTYDRFSDPMNLHYTPIYQSFLNPYLNGAAGSGLPNNSLNNMLKYVRSSSSAMTRMGAWNVVINPMRVGKVDPMKLMMVPGYGTRVDLAAANAFRRMYIDAASLRGNFTADPPTSDAALLTDILGEISGNLKNTDKLRSFATRRLCVDVLKKMQVQPAYAALVDARASVNAEIMGGMLMGDNLTQTTDLLARIDKALQPYYN